MCGEPGAPRSWPAALGSQGLPSGFSQEGDRDILTLTQGPWFAQAWGEGWCPCSITRQGAGSPMLCQEGPQLSIPASFPCIPPSLWLLWQRASRQGGCEQGRAGSVWQTEQGLGTAPCQGSYPGFPGPRAGFEGAGGCRELVGSLWSQRAPLIL